MSWAVAVTRSNMELVAQKGAERQAYQTYLPRFSQAGRVRLLFPGYMFVKIAGAWRSLTGTRGVISVIRNGERPALLQDSDLDCWRSREDATGLVQLDPRFRRGDTVSIERGTFAGQQGIYDGLDARGRVEVLLQMLGRVVKARVGEEDLAEA